MEKVDIYDKDRNYITTLPRDDAWDTPDGQYFVIVAVWTFNKQGEVLLTYRDKTKRFSPCTWENTAGAVLTGETSLEACCRELKEETGIFVNFDEVHFLDTIILDKYLVDHYLCVTDARLDEIILQEGETTDAKFFDAKQLKEMLESNEINSSTLHNYNILKNTIDYKLNTIYKG